MDNFLCFFLASLKNSCYLCRQKEKRDCFRAKFINPFTDIGFKIIFGQEFSKPRLLDFLNALLEGERVIRDLKFLDKQQMAVYDGDRSPIYDILCETDSGEKIIVEMQNREHPNFRERLLYYASEAIARQGEKGKAWNYDIKAVYIVAFTNFVLTGYVGRLRVDVRLTDQDGKLFTEKLRLICLQMPCFTKEAEECENHFERWIYILKNMDTLTRMPWAAQNAVFQRLAEVAEVSKLSKEERLEYDHALKRYRDTYNAMTGAEQKGRAEGRAEGIEDNKRDNARRMKADNMPVELIAKYTGLTKEEIEQL
ncbi:MAG: PD-(D/E)XK nuclease family transposase [Paludibacteraceae bacterium]|nr:PD-(D/E)XK nuclease family transposase [Paludibacteraceae bacterium]